MYFDVKRLMILTCDRCKDDNVAFKLNGNSYASALASKLIIGRTNCKECMDNFKQEYRIHSSAEWFYSSGMCPYDRSG